MSINKRKKMKTAKMIRVKLDPKMFDTRHHTSDGRPKLWTIMFSYSILRSEHNLLAYCEKNALKFQKLPDGIRVYDMNKTQIDNARKLANKKGHSRPLPLEFYYDNTKW